MKRKVSEIKVPAGRRDIDYAKVLRLAESIELIGQLNPISIDKNDNLIAGGHRLAAHEYLGLDEIECIVQDMDELRAKLAEIDENLMRNDLDAIAVGEQAMLRDDVLDALGLRKKPHGNGSNQHQSKSADSARLRTTQDIANEIGLSKRVLQENKQLARNLTDTAKTAVRRVAAPKQDALRLARKPFEEQETIAAKILANQEKTVVDAIRALEREKLRVHLDSIATQEVKAVAGLYDTIVIDPPWNLPMRVLLCREHRQPNRLHWYRSTEIHTTYCPSNRPVLRCRYP